MSEEKGERGTEEMNGFWKRSAGREGRGRTTIRRRGNQSSEEREESVECDLTAEDCGMFGLPRVEVG